MHSDWIDTCNL